VTRTGTRWKTVDGVAPRIVEGMQTRWSRVIRGLGAGTAATLVAAASHSLAGGRVPSVVGVTLALFFSVIVAIAVTGRGMSLVRLTASIVIGQLAFHLVFSTIGGAGEVVATGHHGPMVLRGAETVTHASGGMWFAHGLAAVLTIVALRFGERAIHGLRQTAWMIVSAFLPTQVSLHLPFTTAPQPAVEQHIVPRIVRTSLAAIGTRGPPALCSA
jgi:hypothetical protein